MARVLVRSRGTFDAASAVDCTADITAALARGKPLTGGGKWFGVTGTITLPEGADLSDMKFKQLAPGVSQNVITLSASGVDNVSLRNIVVDRNGDGTNDGNNVAPNGALATARGIYINGGTGHLFENIEVYGDDSGTGVLFVGLDRTTRISGLYVHDMLGIVPSATDDVVQGVSFESCTGLVAYGINVHNLSWKDAAVDPEEFAKSRLIVLSGCVQCTLFAPRGAYANQGIDFTGDLGSGNINCTVISSVMSDITIYGHKAANLSKGLLFLRCISERSGRIGFVDSSDGDSAFTDFDANWYIDCDALDCGSGTDTNGGFAKTDGSRAFHTPAKYLRCRANDRRGTPLMDYGFFNETADLADSYTSVFNCYVANAQDTDFRDIIAEGVGLGAYTWWFPVDAGTAGSNLVSGGTGVETSWSKDATAKEYLVVNRSSGLTLANGANNNVVLTHSSEVIAGPTGAFSITGFVPSRTDGQMLYLFNNTTQAMTLAHENASSTAANRLLMPGAVDLVTAAAKSAHVFQYNGALQRWIYY